MDLGGLHLKFMENWDSFKNTLGKGVDIARDIGVPEDNIESISKNIGDFLSKHVDPENLEQITMKELWDNSSQEDRYHLAHSMINIVGDKSKS